MWGGFCVEAGEKEKESAWGARFLFFSIIDILMGIPSGSLCGGESDLTTITDNMMPFRSTCRQIDNYQEPFSHLKGMTTLGFLPRCVYKTSEVTS